MSRIALILTALIFVLGCATTADSLRTQNLADSTSFSAATPPSCIGVLS